MTHYLISSARCRCFTVRLQYDHCKRLRLLTGKQKGWAGKKWNHPVEDVLYFVGISLHPAKRSGKWRWIGILYQTCDSPSPSLEMCCLWNFAWLFCLSPMPEERLVAVLRMRCTGVELLKRWERSLKRWEVGVARWNVFWQHVFFERAVTAWSVKNLRVRLQNTSALVSRNWYRSLWLRGRTSSYPRGFLFMIPIMAG